MSRLTPSAERQLIAFARLLVDPDGARVAIPPSKPLPGYWFGGGNVTVGPDGALYLVGRYRDAGDSRTGLAAGERGWALVLFRSHNRGQSFEKIATWTKCDLSQPGREVLSIEGSALRWGDSGVELFVSSEKAGIPYPTGLESYRKPGCGVWTIERIAAPTWQELIRAAPETILASDDPEHLHLKDPRCYESNGERVLMCCSHPFNWASSNTVFVSLSHGVATGEPPRYGWFPRGTTWDVAMTRGTCLVDMPSQPGWNGHRVTLLFYDGGECVRDLAQHPAAVARPRGYSCEELGGLAYVLDGDFTRIERLSRTMPLFVSPCGTGCHRYVDVLVTPEGYLATWQQSQTDGSQPLMIRFCERAAAERVLG
ncbi:MAG: hypothetical protein AB7F89_15760 [Pirellulaceae bacterium]